jgi:hypothetical protein
LADFITNALAFRFRYTQPLLDAYSQIETVIAEEEANAPSIPSELTTPGKAVDLGETNERVIYLIAAIGPATPF